MAGPAGHFHHLDKSFRGGSQKAWKSEETWEGKRFSSKLMTWMTWQFFAKPTDSLMFLFIFFIFSFGALTLPFEMGQGDKTGLLFDGRGTYMGCTAASKDAMFKALMLGRHFCKMGVREKAALVSICFNCLIFMFLILLGALWAWMAFSNLFVTLPTPGLLSWQSLADSQLQLLSGVPLCRWMLSLARTCCEHSPFLWVILLICCCFCRGGKPTANQMGSNELEMLISIADAWLAMKPCNGWETLQLQTHGATCLVHHDQHVELEWASALGLRWQEPPKKFSKFGRALQPTRCKMFSHLWLSRMQPFSSAPAPSAPSAPLAPSAPFAAPATAQLGQNSWETEEKKWEE